jgi:Ku70/Ku80 beta-barrel domain
VRKLKLQALRVGELGITAIPSEVFAITGLKLKAQSPLQPTFNIELANGSEGYIPPAEQHRLGGYTTWPARTAALETEAGPKIVEALLQLLEKAAERPRKKPVESQGAYLVLSRAEMESITPATAHEMQILEFVQLAEVDPVYFETSYYAAPDRGGERAYGLLLQRCEPAAWSALHKSRCTGGSTSQSFVPKDWHCAPYDVL